MHCNDLEACGIKCCYFWPDCKAIPAYGLMTSVCLSVRPSVNIWLTFALKFWNLLCNPAIPSSAVACLFQNISRVHCIKMSDSGPLGLLFYGFMGNESKRGRNQLREPQSNSRVICLFRAPHSLYLQCFHQFKDPF